MSSNVEAEVTGSEENQASNATLNGQKTSSEDAVKPAGTDSDSVDANTTNAPKSKEENMQADDNKVDNTDDGAAAAPGDAEPSRDRDSQPPAAADQLSPYAYTASGEYTSENFKIEIRNLPRYYGLAQFRKFLQNQLGLSVRKLKPLPGRGAGMFVALADEPSRQEALRQLDGRVWKKARLTARPAAAVPDPLLARQQKRRQEGGEGEQGAEKRRREEAPLEQRARDAVVPWWAVPYAEQLERKRALVADVLVEYKRALRKTNYPLFRWLEKATPAVEVEPIRPSPVTEHYRNKCEFTVGFHPDTNEPVVGFRLAAYRDGGMAVAPLDGMPHVSARMRAAAAAFQRHVRESGYAPFHAVTHEGHWRQLLVRESRRGDLLLSAQFHPQSLSDDQLRAAQDALREFMTAGPGAELGVTSLFWQTAGRLQSGQERPHELLAGSPHITETLGKLQLQISPDAFFQVNTAAAEVLYDTVGEVAELDGDTTLLDVCCGAGSIGLSLAGRARAVLGIELVEAAVADATRNAELNGITSCRFWTGRAEALLRAVLEQAEGRAVAVVDPPRAGLGREVTQALRRAADLRRVVYVACDARQALRNLTDLARPESNAYAGYPFVVRRLVPVDLFPHTPHVELVAVLERCDPELWRRAAAAESPADADRGQQQETAEKAEEEVEATKEDEATKVDCAEVNVGDGEKSLDSTGEEDSKADGTSKESVPENSESTR